MMPSEAKELGRRAGRAPVGAFGRRGRKIATRHLPRLAVHGFALAALLLGAPGSAKSDELIEAHQPLPVSIDGNTVHLEAFIVKKSDAQGRLPIALLTNGGFPTATGGTAAPGQGYAPIARDLARRGWLAVVVLRRGFGRSEGAMSAPVDCQPSSFNGWASAAADDLQAAIESLAKRPDADPDKIIVIGSVNAGVVAVALSARNPHGLVGAVSISGGLLAESGCPLKDILVDAYKEYGTTSRVPNLWMYSKNDTIFDPALTERMHAAFLDGGGDVKFVMFYHNGNVGPGIFGKAPQAWFTQMDGFLRALQLPTWTADDVKEVIKKLNITEPAAQIQASAVLGEIYFAGPGEKALAYSTATPTGSGPPLWSEFGASTLDAARASALGKCRKQAAQCAIVMENNRWVGGAP